MFEDNPQVQSAPEQPQPAPTPEQPQAAEQPQQPAQTPQPAAPQKPAVPPVKTTQEERMWAAIGYIAFLGVVTLAMMPKSEFCKKHASQGIVLFVLWFIGLILLALPITLVSSLAGIALLGITVLSVIGIVKSISSYEFNLPVLSDLAKLVPTGTIVGGLTGKTPEPTQTPGKEPQQTPVQPEQPQPPATPAQENPTPPTAPAAPAEGNEPQAEKPQENTQ